MKLPQINTRQISVILLAIAALMLLDSLYQVGMHIRWRYWIPASLAVEIPSTQSASSQPAGTQPASQPTATPVAASQASATQAVSRKPAAATQAAASAPAAARAASSQPAASQATAKAPDSPRSAGATGSQPAGASASKQVKPHELAAGIKKRNVMAEPKPPGHGLTLAGVLDNVAFFRNREGKDVIIEEGKAGEGGVKVTKIDGTDVTIEYEGKPVTLNLFSK